MGWDSEADELFPHTVTLTEPGGLNQYGRHKAGTTPLTRRALVEHKMRRVRTVKGEDASSSIAVYLSGAEGVEEIDASWSVVLPDGTDRPIVSVSRYADEEGDLIEVVYLQ